MMNVEVLRRRSTTRKICFSTNNCFSRFCNRAPSSSPVSPIAVPPTHSYPTSGGSILLLHSDTNPPTKPATPTPQDFFDKGKPASTSSTLNHTFVQDSLTDVVLTNNSINTIFYYLMDVAQNITYIGEVTFYVDLK